MGIHPQEDIQVPIHRAINHLHFTGLTVNSMESNVILRLFFHGLVRYFIVCTGFNYNIQFNVLFKRVRLVQYLYFIMGFEQC